MNEIFEIHSNNLLVQVSSKGAELKRLFNKDWDKDLIWPGDENFWNRSAPILFPIVGKLKDNEYFYNDFTYSMPRHGFARDAHFICIRHEENVIELKLTYSTETLKIYPFSFELSVIFTVERCKLCVNYCVKNQGMNEMYFSIGSHPAFNINPIENYEIHFSQKEEHFIGLSNDYIDFNSKQDFHSNKLALSENLFDKDALIFNKPNSQSVTLYDFVNKRSIKTTSQNVKHWALWAKLKAPFICIEAWHGIADQEFHDKKIINKRDIIKLQKGAEFKFNYEIEMN